MVVRAVRGELVPGGFSLIYAKIQGKFQKYIGFGQFAVEKSRRSRRLAADLHRSANRKISSGSRETHARNREPAEGSLIDVKDRI